MKTRQIWAATGCLLSMLMSGAVQAQARDTSFTFSNDTAFTVYSIYIWPIADDNHGPDRLGRRVLTSGGSKFFAPSNGYCLYNVQVTLENQEKRWDDVDLCALNVLTLHYNHMTHVISASSD